MASILLTPFVLYFSLPYCTHAILEFVRDNTVFVEGVGDICSLANFDFEKHGNSKYGAITHCPKVIPISWLKQALCGADNVGTAFCFHDGWSVACLMLRVASLHGVL